jgi:hypothetical protein
MPRLPMPDVIVLLPGILGSALKKDKDEVWGLSAGAIFRAITSLGDSVKSLELRNDTDEDVDIGDGIVATHVLPDVHLIPGLWKIDGYAKIAKAIKKIFKVTPGENYFEFPYDWRRPNRVAALRLERMAKGWLDQWRQKSPDAQLILIGHSMGGLVARYYLEERGGWERTRALITFGTPHRGSLNALDFIANGYRKKVLGATLLDLTALLRSMPSVYELLPIYPCCWVGKMVYPKDANIPNLNPTMLDRALKFHKAIQDGVGKRGKTFDNRIHPVVGTHQPTLQSALVNGASVQVIPSFENQDIGGDGTVPRVSATPIELSDAGRDVFAAERHASLQNNDGVWVQVEGILQTGNLDLGAFKVPEVRLSLDIDDAYAAAEPVSFRCRPDKELASLQALITRTDAPEEKSKHKMTKQPDGWHVAEIPALMPGAYRVTVYGDARVVPVTDVFAVM